MFYLATNLDVAILCTFVIRGIDLGGDVRRDLFGLLGHRAVQLHEHVTRNLEGLTGLILDGGELGFGLVGDLNGRTLTHLGVEEVSTHVDSRGDGTTDPLEAGLQDTIWVMLKYYILSSLGDVVHHIVVVLERNVEHIAAMHLDRLLELWDLHGLRERNQLDDGGQRREEVLELFAVRNEYPIQAYV